MSVKTVLSDEEIQRLHQKYAPTADAYNLIYTHCQIIWTIAKQLIAKNNLDYLDKDLVRVGCLLHDIGVYRLYNSDGDLDRDNYIKHGTLGYEVLKSEGFDEAICRVASHHTGVGLTKRDVEEFNLPLPPQDFLAESPEERLIMYADKFHSKTPKFNSFNDYKEYIGRFGKDKQHKFEELANEFGKPDLEGIKKQYESSN